MGVIIIFQQYNIKYKQIKIVELIFIEQDKLSKNMILIFGGFFVLNLGQNVSIYVQKLEGNIN